MKICLLMEFYKPMIMGGAEIDAEYFVDDLAGKGFEVYVLTPNYGNFKTEIEKKENVTIHRFRSLRYFLFKDAVRRKSQKTYTKNNALFSLLLNQYMKFSSRELAVRFNKLNKKNKFDLVHVNNIESIGALPHIKGDIKRIATAQDLRSVCLSNRTIDTDYCEKCSVKNIKKCFKTNSLLAFLLKNDFVKKNIKNLKKADKIFTPTTYYQNEIERTINKKNTYLIPNPVRNFMISNLTKDEAKRKCGLTYEKIVLFAGAFTTQKGGQYIPILAKNFPEYDFVMVGHGPLKEEFKKHDLENLHVMDFIEQKELVYFYRAADILISLMNFHGGFGKIVSEAQMNKLPVVAFDVKYIEEVIKHKETGYLIPLNDEKAILGGVKELMGDEALRNNISDKAYEFVKEKYDPEKILNKIISVYHGNPSRQIN